MKADRYRWRCACCGQEMTGLPMALHFSEPVDWDAHAEEICEGAWVNEDFCFFRLVSGDVHRYIRAILQLDVSGVREQFQFGIWVSVSERSWDVYREGFVSGTYAEPGCFGYLMHDIPDFEGARYLPCDVDFQPDRLRPLVRLHDADHPLVAAQRDGVALWQVERWAALMHGQAGIGPQA